MALRATLVARGANVFACARLINLVRPASTQIPLNHQKALWFSGLRGAMAFALALQSMHDLPDKGHGRAIFTTTTAIVVITVLIIGGSTSTMLSKLGVTGSDYVAMSAENAEVMENFTIADDDDFSNGYDEVKSRLQESPRSSSSFVDFDNKFIRPLLTTRTGDSNDTIKGLKHVDEAGRGISFVPIQKHSQTPDGP